MKKFKKEDILINTIKAHPKVEFFMNNGVIWWDRQHYPDKSSDVPYGSVGLFELVNKVLPPRFGTEVDGALLTEESDFIMTEDDQNLAFE